MGLYLELTHLMVDGCWAVQSLPEGLNQLVKMEGLALTNLNLTSFKIKISQMPALMYVLLNGNPFGRVPPVLYAQLPPRCFALGLSNTSISSIPDAALVRWKDQLVTLHLEFNPLENFPIGLVEFHKLTNLRLPRTGIQALPANFTLIQNLYTLEMSSCALTRLSALDQFPKLRRLNLANNSLTEPPALRQPELFVMIEWSLNPFCALKAHHQTQSCRPRCSPDCSSTMSAAYS